MLQFSVTQGVHEGYHGPNVLQIRGDIAFTTRSLMLLEIDGEGR